MTAASSALVAAVFGEFGAIAGQPRPAGTVVVGVPYRLSSLDPAASPVDPNQPQALSPYRLIYDTLVITGPDGRLYPHLAAGWEIGAGGKEITFRLRRGVRFHDGRPVDAGAVKYTLDRLTEAPESGTLARMLGPVKEVIVVDPERVRLVFERPYPPVWTALSWSAYGVVAPGGEAGALGPVGSGPFRPESLTGGRLTLVANDGYDWPPPFVKGPGPARPRQVVFEFLPERGSLSAAFGGSRLDVAEFGQGESWQGPPGLVVHRPTLTYLGFNVADGPMADPAVREAAALAIDRQALIDKVGLPATAETSVIPGGMWASGLKAGSKGDGLPAYDPARAKAVLAADGWKDTDGDGLVERPGLNGAPPSRLRVEVLSYDYQWEAGLGKAVSEQLRAVGIEALATTLEPRDVLERTREGLAPAFVLTYDWYDPDVIYYFFHSSRLGLTNRSRLDDPAV
ncbi:MAG TPA: ABC transporter substrate-binding protein, partial [Bacillota bacterium]